MKLLYKQIVTSILGMALCAASGAAEIEGVKLAERVQVVEGGPELVLNGAGVRTRLVFKVYVGALYLPQKQAAAQTILNDAGMRRVALHLLREVSSEQLFSALNDGLKSNHTPDQLAKLEPQIRQLESIFKSVAAPKNGDVILIDALPGSAGTRITLNGDAKGTIPGADFNRALMRIWLGDNPVDGALKKAMLGG